MNDVVGAEAVACVMPDDGCVECIISHKNSAIFLPQMADGSTRAT